MLRAVSRPVPALTAPLLAELAASPRPPLLAETPEEIRIEALIAAQELTVMPDQHRLGPLSPLACPDCHGSMVEIREGDLLRFRCHSGPAFTLETLRLAQGEAWERTLYAAMRAQQEQAMLVGRLVAEAEAKGHTCSAAALARRERDYEEGAEVIRRLLARGNGLPTSPIPEAWRLDRVSTRPAGAHQEICGVAGIASDVSLSCLESLYGYGRLAHGQRQPPPGHRRNRRLRWRAAADSEAARAVAP